MDLQTEEWWHPVLVQRCRGEKTIGTNSSPALPETPRPEWLITEVFPGHELLADGLSKWDFFPVIPKPPPRVV
ncbi:MAG: hypothetical protein NZM42_04240 [Gemmatales bacterium]|nr:hypothetical protein [Gemmatales bacterium]MDW8222598.1 hypothetical protein [Gemmatales bacterium]